MCHMLYVVVTPGKKVCPHMSICARTTFCGAPKYSQVVTSEYVVALFFTVVNVDYSVVIWFNPSKEIRN